MVDKKEFWQDELKESHGEPLVKVLTEIHDSQERTEKKVDKTMTVVENIEKAFPNADFEGHRRYHQSVIEMLEERKKFYREITKKTIIGVLWALMVWVGIAVYHEILSIFQHNK